MLNWPFPGKIYIGACWKPLLRIYLFYELYFEVIIPDFYYISAGMVRSFSHGDVSMMNY